MDRLQEIILFILAFVGTTVTVPGLASDGPPPPTPTPTATPTATPTPIPVATPQSAFPPGPRTLSINELYDLAIAAGFPPGTRDTAVAVALCESSGYTHAVGLANERGLWQIHPVHGWRWEQAFDPLSNAQSAYKIWQESGWQPWPNCP